MGRPGPCQVGLLPGTRYPGTCVARGRSSISIHTRGWLAGQVNFACSKPLPFRALNARHIGVCVPTQPARPRSLSLKPCWRWAQTQPVATRLPSGVPPDDLFTALTRAGVAGHASGRSLRVAELGFKSLGAGRACQQFWGLATTSQQKVCCA